MILYGYCFENQQKEEDILSDILFLCIYHDFIIDIIAMAQIRAVPQYCLRISHRTPKIE